MDIKKKKIKHNLLKEISNYYEITLEMLEGIDFLVNDICDLSEYLLGELQLSEQNTFILRKRLGVYDNGEIQTLRVIAKEVDRSFERVRQIKDSIYATIVESLSKGNYGLKDNKTKMSSILVTGNYKDYHIGKMDLSKNITKHFSNDIKTLYDLLSYGEYELKKMGLSELCIRSIKEKVHSLGLKFIDELSNGEKRTIISLSDEEVVDNSSLSWLGINDNSTINNLNIHKVNDIGMFKKYVKSGGSIDKAILDNAASIGIKIDRDKLEANSMVSMQEVLDTDIQNIEMSVQLYNALKRNGIKTIKDIVSYNKKDIIKIRSMGKIKQEELNQIIHNLGLLFADEVPIMQSYISKISSIIDSESTSEDIKLKEEELLRTYRYLVYEKSKLESQTRQLETKINVLIEEYMKLKNIGDISEKQKKL